MPSAVLAAAVAEAVHPVREEAAIPRREALAVAPVAAADMTTIIMPRAAVAVEAAEDSFYGIRFAKNPIKNHNK